jgi:hypothetical protein
MSLINWAVVEIKMVLMALTKSTCNLVRGMLCSQGNKNLFNRKGFAAIAADCSNIVKGLFTEYKINL